MSDKLYAMCDEDPNVELGKSFPISFTVFWYISTIKIIFKLFEIFFQQQQQQPLLLILFSFYCIFFIFPSFWKKPDQMFEVF